MGKEIEVAILFADVVGSTKLYELLGDLRLVDRLARCGLFACGAAGDVALGHIDVDELGVVVRPIVDALDVVVDEQGRDHADHGGDGQAQQPCAT